MNTLIAMYHAHPALWTLGGYYVLSAAIGNLPMPDATSGKGYRWFFGFSNALAANVARAMASRLPKDVTIQAPPAATPKA